jgi:hypothetical protein
MKGMRGMRVTRSHERPTVLTAAIDHSERVTEPVEIPAGHDPTSLATRLVPRYPGGGQPDGFTPSAEQWMKPATADALATLALPGAQRDAYAVLVRRHRRGHLSASVFLAKVRGLAWSLRRKTAAPTAEVAPPRSSPPPPDPQENE